MADLTVKQKQIFDNYKKTHPKMSDAEILSALVNLGQIQLSEEQKLSLFNNSTNNDSGMGLKLEHTQKSANPTNQPQETIFLQSGRKIVITKSQDGKDLYKYYAADGTQLNPDNFKQQEGVVRVSANRKTYTVTKNGKSVLRKVKDPLIAKIDQQQTELNKTKNEQGFLGKAWDWFKNKTDSFLPVDSSNEAQKQLDKERNLVKQIQKGKISKKDFQEVTGLEYSKENLQKFKNGEIELKSTEKIKGYQEGQEMACDVAGDLVSGIAAVGAYSLGVALAPVTGGTSLVAAVAVGGAFAIGTGAGVKAGLKYADAKSAGKEYTSGWHDAATGAFSGVLAPITGGTGGAIGKTVATKLGIQAVKSVGKEASTAVAESALRTALTNPTGYEYVGGTMAKRALAMSAEMATDGALGGAIDGGFRAGLDNDWDSSAILSGTVEGGIGGALMAPIIGGGFKAVGKGGHKLGEGVKEKIKGNSGNSDIEPTNTTTLHGKKAAKEVIDGALGKEIAENSDLTPNEITTKPKIEGTASERINSNKKSYQKPEIQEKSLIPKDDLMANTSEVVPSVLEKTRQNITQFATSTVFDNALSKGRINFSLFGKDGIPLKYSRESFIKDLVELLSGLSPVERAKIESEFGIRIEKTKFNTLGKEIEGIPIIPESYGRTKNEQAVANLIRKFVVENEVLIADKETKELLESVLQTFPEFAMTIGKKQHDTHSFSVDIHTLRNLQDNLANPKYSELDAESQLVLKYATILHDIGKRFLGDRQPDHGHSALSVEYATKILERFDLLDEVKERIIKQIKHHHWFEEYNKGNQTPELVAKVVETFGTKEDFAVAEIMAKSDYMNVNDGFHLSRARSRVKGDGLMSETEFDDFMNSSFEKIEKEFKAKSKLTENTLSYELKNNELATTNEAKHLLQDMGFPKDEIENVEFNENILTLIIPFYTIYKTKVFGEQQIFQDIATNKESRIQILELLKNAEDVDFSRPEDRIMIKYMNIENIEFLKKHCDLGNECLSKGPMDYLFRILENADGNPSFIPEKLKAITILSENGKHKLDEYDFWIFDNIKMEDFRLITEKRVNFIRQIMKEAKNNECNPTIKDMLYIGEEADLTEELLNNYIKEKNRFYKLFKSYDDPYFNPTENGGEVTIKDINKIRKGMCDAFEKISGDTSIEEPIKTYLLSSISKGNYNILLKYYNNPKFIKFLQDCNGFSLDFINKHNSDIFEKLFNNENFPREYIKSICNNISITNRYNTRNLALNLLNDNILPENIAIILNAAKYTENHMSRYWSSESIEKLDKFVLKCLKEEDCDIKSFANLIRETTHERLNLLETLDIYKELPMSLKFILIQADCPDLLISRLENPKFRSDILNTHNSNNVTPSFVSLFTRGYHLIGKTSISELTKLEKREMITFLLANKNTITKGNNDVSIKELIPLLPTNADEYALMIKKVSNSLSISTEPISAKQIVKFNQAINSFSHYLKEADLSKLDEINLTMPHSEFISRVENIIKHLPKEEQAKIQDFYGFQIIDGKLSGYPNLNAKDLNLAEITDEQSIIVVDKLRKVIDDYVNNNFVTVKDNPLLNQQLKELSKVLPEIFNQIDGSKASVNMIKSLQKIVKNAVFEKLSESDKRVIIIATLLHNTDKISNNISESAFDAFFIAKKFNMTDEEAQKVYSIIEASDFVEEFMRTHKRPTEVNIRAAIIGQEREDKFDLMAFKLKEGNNYELAQMLYSAKYQEGFTRYFDKILSDRIRQMKANDFILPQTSIEHYLSQAQRATIEREGATYDVQIVDSKNIKDFYAIIHTPEAGFATGGTRGANFANFDAFAVLNDDKVICTSYVGNDLAGLVKEYHNGFIFDIQNDKQYVGYGTDIYSLAKNIPNMIVEYFRDRGFQANRGRGQKYEHRTMISSVLKSLLYGKDYYNITKNVDVQITAIRQKYKTKLDEVNDIRKQFYYQMLGTKDITYAQYLELKHNQEFIELEKRVSALEKQIRTQQAQEIQNIPGYTDIKEMDELYIKRLDEVKAKLGNRTMTLENIEEIDPEFAKAYREFLKRNGTEHTGEASLLRSNWHNEVLVSNPKISAIFTDDLDNIPEEYLIKAQEENLPIVVIK